MRRSVPAVVMEWFNSVVESNRKEAKSKDSEDRIEWKVEHTKRVVIWGEKIMNREQRMWNWEQGLVVCQLHDVGRFPQSLYGTFVDKISIDHAAIGKEIFKKADLDLNAFDGNKEEIVEAIGEHNNPNYCGNNIYVKLARDADQLAILEEFEWQVTKSHKTHEFTGQISGGMQDDYENNRVISTRDARTIGEWMLCVKSWKKHLNFKASLDLYKENAFDEKIKLSYNEKFSRETRGAKLFEV
jgi:hypothetical protein